MAKVVKPLTNTEILNAKPKEKEYNLSDGVGLILRIKPNGNKVWLFNYYRPHDKKRRANLKIGNFPEVTLSSARSKRVEYAALLAENIDPQYEKRRKLIESKRDSEATFETISKQWLEIKKNSVTPAYAENIERSIKNHLFPHSEKVSTS